MAKLNPAGSALVYSTYLGGSSNDYGNGIAVDRHGNAYIAGSPTSTDFPTTVNAFETAASGLGDAFVTKLTPTGHPRSTRLICTLSGTEHCRGRFWECLYYRCHLEWFSHRKRTSAQPGGGTDAFVTKLNPSGNRPGLLNFPRGQR